ncbi:MAG: protease SohB [Gammaproteobacteria bacterium]|nr:MAG: protease SohB [Gammaproteobacteria bacterium]
MIEFLTDYGLFLAKLTTAAVIVLVVVGFIVASTKRSVHQDGLDVEDLNKRFENLGDVVRRAVHGKEQFKKDSKGRRKDAKRLAKKGSQRQRMFVLDFKGDIRASATASLREEVSAVLAVATKEDKVLVRLENAGGTVHEHGLAASQLVRIKARGVPLFVSVDKVAASGGYLMACVADRIMAAPFAIIGSIGVIAQLPNFHRLLEDKGVDFEQVTAGRYKRTLTMFGKNTDEGRAKIKAELEDVHELFKNQIAEHRPQIDLDKISTGEHWYGVRAMTLNLVDEIRTSDDFLLEAASDYDIFSVTYKRRRSLSERLLGGVESLLSR